LKQGVTYSSEFTKALVQQELPKKTLPVTKKIKSKG
jgi:hypothetical protein